MTNSEKKIEHHLKKKWSKNNLNFFYWPSYTVRLPYIRNTIIVPRNKGRNPSQWCYANPTSNYWATEQNDAPFYMSINPMLVVLSNILMYNVLSGFTVDYYLHLLPWVQLVYDRRSSFPIVLIDFYMNIYASITKIQSTFWHVPKTRILGLIILK